MTNLIISKLDYQRLKVSVGNAKSDPRASSNQVRTLWKGVNEATLLEPNDMPADVVTMNSWVRIRYMDTDRTVSLRLVYPEQADIHQNQVSIFAPLATAILGVKVGDLINLPTPSHTVKIKVDQLLYQPEAAGDFSL
ncbi:GreA/GreB family elongation factor [Nibrella saemangeumensis]